MGVEPTSPAWEAGVITVIRRPHSGERPQSYYSAHPRDDVARVRADTDRDALQGVLRAWAAPRLAQGAVSFPGIRPYRCLSTGERVWSV